MVLMTDISASSQRPLTAANFRELCQWAVMALKAPLPETVRRRAALILMDDIGAMVAASSEPEVKQARGGLARSWGPAEAVVFARGARRLDRYSAAAANGMAITWSELDEGFRGAPCHAGAYALPALLAEAECGEVQVADVLRALAIAYEVTARIALTFPFATMPVHPHAIFAPIGAAAGATLMRGCHADRLLDAVSGAASMAFAGPFGHATEGALVRNAWTSAGAWIGLRMADWAAIGIGGLDITLYDVFVGSFGAGCAPEALTRGLGKDWAVSGGYHKIFACCQYAHSAVEASLVLRRRLEREGRDANEIEAITVETHPLGQKLTTVEPNTVLAAKFSMPHAAAATAVLGTGAAEAFTRDKLADDRIARLRRKVQLLPYAEIGAWPKDRPARVAWRFADGETWTEICESARGGADQPFDEATIIAKVESSSGGAFPNLPRMLTDIVKGKATALRQPWREAVVEMVKETAA
jgi:2-methylcitrate dehydratase PrpD